MKTVKLVDLAKTIRSKNAETDRITDFVEYDPANAIKFTISRLKPSGSPGDSDVFGSQQHAPLLDIEIPVN